MKQILVIDPSINDFQTANSILGYAGYKLSHCADPLAINDVIAAQTPDVILIEMITPNKSFFAIMRELKNSSFASIPVVAVCSMADSNRSVASTLGACDFVVKPYVFADLLAAIQKACQ